MISGVFESTADEVLTRPTGEYMATRCGHCDGYKKDALVGPYANLFRYVTKFCACTEPKVTLTMTTEALDSLLALAATST